MSVSNPTPSRGGDDPPNCAICLCEMDSSSNLATLLCDHQFHETCISQWMLVQLNSEGSAGSWSPPNCPVCRGSAEESKEHGDLLANLGKDKLIDLIQNQLLPKQKALDYEAERIQSAITFHANYCPVHNGTFRNSRVVWMGTDFDLNPQTRMGVADSIFQQFETRETNMDDLQVVFHIQQS